MRQSEKTQRLGGGSRRRQTIGHFLSVKTPKTITELRFSVVGLMKRYSNPV
jgi:hypothetical protein